MSEQQMQRPVPASKMDVISPQPPSFSSYPISSASRAPTAPFIPFQGQGGVHQSYVPPFAFSTPYSSQAYPSQVPLPFQPPQQSFPAQQILVPQAPVVRQQQQQQQQLPSIGVQQGSQPTITFSQLGGSAAQQTGMSALTNEVTSGDDPLRCVRLALRQGGSAGESQSVEHLKPGTIPELPSAVSLPVS